MKPRQLIAAILPMVLALPCWGQDGVVTIEGTRIHGDQEMPTVMYLVPWQPPTVQALAAPDESLMLEQGIAPLEREAFQRLVSYHRRFQVIHQPRGVQEAGQGAE